MENATGDHDAHGGTGKYWIVFLLLCILTSASFFTYSSYWPFKDTPSVAWAFMMAVSCTKAMLVILFFMHLLWEANWKYVLTIPAGMMSIFLMLMLVPDIGLRTRNYSEERLLRAAEPEVHSTSSHGDPDHDDHDSNHHPSMEHDEGEHDGHHGGDGH